MRAAVAPALVAACLALSSAPGLARLPGAGPVWDDVIEAGSTEYERALSAGREAAAEGDTEAAIAAFRAARAASPDRLGAVALEARELIRAGRYDEAVALTDGLGARDDRAERTRTLFFRSIALTLLGRFDEAAAELEAATRYRTDLAQAEIYYGNLAELHVALGDLELGLLFYQQALNANAEYGVARLGLAIALERLGRSSEAELQVLRALVEDPGATFLDQPGMFFVPSGEEALYRALVAAALGEHAEARRRLEEYRSTPAGDAAPEAMLERLEESFSGPGVEVEAIALSGCVATQIAVSPAEDRVAVHCEYGGLREAPLGPTPTWRAPIAEAGDAAIDYYSYTVVDLAYAPDGRSVRLLHSDGSVQVYDIDGPAPALTRTVHYDNQSVQPARFIAGGERVVFVGSGSGGLQTDPWDTTPVTVHLTYPLPSMWLYQPAMSDDESRAVSIDGTVLRILAAPAWTEVATVYMPTSVSRFVPFAITPNGRRVIVARGAGLVSYGTDSGDPTAMVSLRAVAPEIELDPWTGISAIEPLGDERVAVGTANAIYLVDLPD